MTDLKTLKQLIKLMVDNGLTELDLEGEGEKVKLKRGSGEPQVHYVSAPPSAVGVSHAPPPAGGVAPSAAPGETVAADAAAAAQLQIVSPMVGTFYAAASPDARPFVNVGDEVGVDTVVCIVEAMKVFNEIKAEVRGTIEKILVNSGQAVEFSQPLFVLKGSGA